MNRCAERKPDCAFEGCGECEECGVEICSQCSIASGEHRVCKKCYGDPAYA